MIGAPGGASYPGMALSRFALYHYDWQRQRSVCRQMKCLHTMLRRRRRLAVLPRQAQAPGRVVALCVWRSGHQRRVWLELARQDGADRDTFLWRQRARTW